MTIMIKKINHQKIVTVRIAKGEVDILLQVKMVKKVKIDKRI